MDSGPSKPPPYDSKDYSEVLNGKAKPFVAAEYANDGKHHVLLAATGSVATIKLPLIAKALTDSDNVSVRVILTPSAENFLQGQAKEQPDIEQVDQLLGIDAVYHDGDEWAKPWVRGDPILHIELRRWAHVLVIAPLSANSLAKIVNGMSDSLVTSVVRAWDTTGMIDGKRKRIFVAPAMNTAMWQHPVTTKQIRVLEKDWGNDQGGWFYVLRPVQKALACGDNGNGAMMEWTQIVQQVRRHLGVPGNLILNETIA